MSEFNSSAVAVKTISTLMISTLLQLRYRQYLQVNQKEEIHKSSTGAFEKAIDLPHRRFFYVRAYLRIPNYTIYSIAD